MRDERVLNAASYDAFVDKLQAAIDPVPTSFLLQSLLELGLNGITYPVGTVLEHGPNGSVTVDDTVEEPRPKGVTSDVGTVEEPGPERVVSVTANVEGIGRKGIASDVGIVEEPEPGPKRSSASLPPSKGSGGRKSRATSVLSKTGLGGRKSQAPLKDIYSTVEGIGLSGIVIDGTLNAGELDQPARLKKRKFDMIDHVGSSNTGSASQEGNGSNRGDPIQPEFFVGDDVDDFILIEVFFCHFPCGDFVINKCLES